MLVAKRRHQLTLCEQPVNQRTSAERDALPIDCGLNQQIVLIEAQ